MVHRPPGGRDGGSPVLLAGGLAVFALVTADVLAGGPLRALDGWVSGRVRAAGLPRPDQHLALRTFFGVLADLGGPTTIGVVVLAVAALLARRERSVRPLVRLAVLGVLVGGTVYALKTGIARPPPSGVEPGGPHRSYPSGHTATAVACWGLLAALVADAYPAGAARRATRVLRLLGPLLAAVGLVVLDYHWVSDVLGGAAVSVVLLQVEPWALRHWPGARRAGSDATTRPEGVAGGGGGAAGAGRPAGARRRGD